MNCVDFWLWFFANPLFIIISIMFAAVSFVIFTCTKKNRRKIKKNKNEEIGYNQKITA